MTAAPEPQDEQVPEQPFPGPAHPAPADAGGPTPTKPPAVVSVGARHVKQPGAPGLAEVPTSANTHAAY